MLRTVLKCTVLLLFSVAVLSTGAWASSTTYDPCTGAPKDSAAGYKSIAKVKPPTATGTTAAPAPVVKAKPGQGIVQSLRGISGFIPTEWGPDCCLPMPAQGQFVLAPRVLFGRVQGEARYGAAVTGLQSSLINFSDHLAMPKSGHNIWSLQAFYQFQPRWGIRYSYSPMKAEGTGQPVTTFTFGGQTFAGGTTLRSKWERSEHRLGLVLDLKRTTSSVTSVFADWMHIQDKLSIGAALGPEALVTWNDDKNLALLGVEFNKCLKNYRGSTLAIGLKGGVAFLDDHIGYDAEASLSYLIPIKQGRFGFVKGGYHYAQLKKDKAAQQFNTTVDGAFVEVGFLF
ncbi:MAG: hypothetical protein AB1473_11605 [Thermodesulfobacteriota bacterium]